MKVAQVKKEGLSSEERRLARFMPSIFQEVRVQYSAGSWTACRAATIQTSISVAAPTPPLTPDTLIGRHGQMLYIFSLIDTVGSMCFLVPWN